MTACDRCLRHGWLLGLLAPRVSNLLGRPGPARRTGAVGTPLLALDEEGLIDAVCGAGERADPARKLLREFEPAAARGALAAAGVEAVCRHSPGYPSRLSDLRDSPPVLFVAGSLERLARLAARPCVTIVGAREPSPYGLEMARSLGRGLAAAGVTVISGLALGIDAAAHLGACTADEGAALAVIARGPEAPYPRRHAPLYRRIRRAGCVIAELPPGTGVYRWAFPARNRLMAGLADVTVVVEAADPSGSLITAAFALDLHRDVGAVPGRVTSAVARGSNRLLEDGAQVILGVDSILGLLGVDEPGREHRSPALELAPPPALEPPFELEPPLPDVLAAIEAAADHHEVAARAGLDAGPLRAALGRLELLGLVRRDDLGGYIRAAP